MTPETIRSAEPGSVIYDRGEKASVKGLHLRSYPNGKKSFLLFYRTRAGVQRRPKLGDFPEITLSDARKRAKALLDEVAIGKDPKGAWDEKKRELTVDELFEMCWAAHWDHERYQKSGWAKEAKRLYMKHLKPTFGNAVLSAVSPAWVRNWHKAYESKPYAGNRALAVFSKIFCHAEEQEIRPQHTNPCALVKSHPEAKRKRFATPEEIGLLAQLLEREEKKFPAAVAFVYLLMFSGSRPRAIERATWDQLEEFEVNGQLHGILKFSGKTSEKTGEEERVILPPQAMRVLARLPRIEGRTITGMKMPRKLWARIKKEAGCEDLWARDWRRTFATVGMSDGMAIGTIGELLNHRSAETTKIYAKVMDEKQVEAAKSIAQKIDSIIVQAKKDQKKEQVGK